MHIFSFSLLILTHCSFSTQSIFGFFFHFILFHFRPSAQALFYPSFHFSLYLRCGAYGACVFVFHNIFMGQLNWKSQKIKYSMVWADLFLASEHATSQVCCYFIFCLIISRLHIFGFLLLFLCDKQYKCVNESVHRLNFDETCTVYMRYCLWPPMSFSLHHIFRFFLHFSIILMIEKWDLHWRLKLVMARMSIDF